MEVDIYLFRAGHEGDSEREGEQVEVERDGGMDIETEVIRRRLLPPLLLSLRWTRTLYHFQP